MLAALLKMMSDGQFHSGEELGGALGVSRAAVWKALKRLEDDGYPLQRVRGKGYRVPRGASMLDLAVIQAAAEVSRERVGWQLLDAVDSTNAELMRQLATPGTGDGTRICIAEQQTSGKGRRGRVWVSPYAQNIYLSVAVPFTEGAKKLEGLSLLVGLVLAECLEGFGYRGVGLKWPNDILLDGRKLAGVLVEIAGDLTSDCVAVIGVGVNVLMAGVDAGIDQAWTSLLLSRQRATLDRNALIGEFIRRMFAALEVFRREGFEPFLEAWSRHHLWQGQQVRVQAGDNSWTGKAIGVDVRGALRLQTSAGDMLLHGGEVTLRLNDDS